MSPDKQREVASWAATTAMCVEKTFPTATQAIPTDYYSALYADTSRPPNDLVVWAGCYLGETPFGISHRSWPLWQFVKRQPSKMFQATYRIGHLILQLSGSQPGDDFLLVSDRSQNLLQLWPPLDHDQTWPPKFVFDDEAYERFSAVAFPES